VGLISSGAAQSVQFTTFGSSNCSTLEITNIDFVEVGQCVGFENIPLASFQTITSAGCAAGESTFLHIASGACNAAADLDVVGPLDGTACVVWDPETAPDHAYLVCQ
jgi:hypothetical protein